MKRIFKRTWCLLLALCLICTCIPLGITARAAEAAPVPVFTHASNLSEGVQNIVKRAEQMMAIQWTPQKDIKGWRSNYTYKAGVTYTGLPYGRPTDGDYVPWETDLDGFLEAVNDPGSKMYTSYSTNQGRAPYYSLDCSAFVSWAWGLSSRQYTWGIPDYAFKVSSSSYAKMEVGDCLSRSGWHVVLVTDIVYDASGKIVAVELAESDGNAPNGLCHTFWFGQGYSQSMSDFQNYYFGDGYILYRSKTRDSVTYTHSCASPLPGDSCSCIHPHSYSMAVTAPTCTDTGYTTYTCACGDSYVADEVPALGHDYTDRVCNRCGYAVVLNTPAKPHKIVNVVSGVHVYWKATEGAQKYGVWRSETGKDGSYKWLGNPTVPHFTDVTAESGKTYYYRVTSMAEGFHSDQSEAIGITFVSTPDITSRANTAAGVQLGWEQIQGATGYAIYRKSYSGTDAWARIATIEGSDTLSWTDTSVKNNNGEAYKYTIRALAGSNMKTLSGCRSAGRTMVRLSSQYIKSIESSGSTSVKLSWSTSSRVTGYEVRFLVDGEEYKTFTIGNYKTGTKTFTDLKADRTYTVQVRTYKAVDGVGSFYSDWSKPWNVTT